jgi:TatD DNase family protein
MLIDTHCHIHDSDYPINGDDVIERAHQSGVMQMICIGTNIDDSKLALDFAGKHDGVFASVGIHPHYAKEGIGGLENIVELLYSRKHLQPEFDKAPGPLSDPARSRFLNKRSRQGDLTHNRKLVAIGEIGLDYHYDNSPRDYQIKILKSQIELALKYDLPIIFHVREAYDDFWEVLDSFKSDKRKIRGVLHCFTDSMKNAEKGINRGLYIAVNGISTFTKDENQAEMFAKIPLDKLLFETDAPYLTPVPLRGKVKVNEPAYVKNIAEHNSTIHQISFDEIADITTANAKKLFNI